jgi:extensin-like protein
MIALGAAAAAAPDTRTRAKPARRSGVVKANGSNMPRGFTWPPSRTMLEAERRCERALDAAGVAWHHASREGRIVDAVTIASPGAAGGRSTHGGSAESIDNTMLGGIAYTPVFGKGPYKLDCQLALALVEIGPALADAGVREVRFGSIYRWSKVRVGGKTKDALSRHALGLAMDVVSFVDGDGREARVARDYRDGDALLLDVERRIDASAAFRLVLTPQNDPISHSDHFHLEANPSYARAAARH